MKMQKGAVGPWIFFLAVAIVLGIMITGGTNIVSKKDKPVTQEKTYIIEEELPEGARESLQLRKVGFIELKTTTADCGHGDIKGTNEYFVLWATDPGPGQFVGQGGLIKAFYTDEWALTLGAGDVSPLTKSPDHIVNPNVGDKARKDKDGFPYFPALFISDITDDPNNNSGDSQNGGKAYPPDEIYGTWQPLGKKADVKFRNYFNLGEGADTFPMKSNLWKNEGKLADGPPKYERNYTAEVIWKVDNLGLINGHTYRAQLILHDGDREGDTGQACTTIKY
jgi:hypothetical protein